MVKAVFSGHPAARRRKKDLKWGFDMITYTVLTQRYEMDVPTLLKRRMVQSGCVYGLMEQEGRVMVTVNEGEQQAKLAEALVLLLSRDLMQLELAGYIDGLPLSLPEKRAVLTGVLQDLRQAPGHRGMLEQMTAYLAGEHVLNLEGYMRFRMGAWLEKWREHTLHAVGEMALRKEYAELMGILHTFVESQQPGAGELSICLNPDGSCTLTDDSDARIEYVDCSEDGVISLLIGMAPTFLTVYDLTGGNGRKLTDAIRRVFAGRVKIFR